MRHIRDNPDLYAETCLSRNYPNLATNPSRINELHARRQTLQEDARSLRERANVLKKQLPQLKKDGKDVEEALQEAREIKMKLVGVEKEETDAMTEMEELALALPNLTSEETPRGAEFEVLSYINSDEGTTSLIKDNGSKAVSHVDIGTRLGILDFASAGTASGWGWYYLLGAGSLLEHALVSYALAVATRYGWTPVSPPSMVYSHISSACGFQPRDASGEQQVYTLAQDEKDKARGVPEMSLTGTSEIALAGMKANTTIGESELPLKRVAASRCYRAEAGARGADTKGLYRVHEFTKVELFAWTHPDQDITTEVFDEMLDIQTEILGSLGLTCRILEMPTHDLGASATRKIDMEAFFPSRAVGKTPAEAQEAGWGEVTSASICTDYQSRRLATRTRVGGEKLGFPWTVNGTALAVPRVLAALLENGWDGEKGSVLVPEVLRPWMGGMERIEGPRRK
jgi:seryl-tRNA synthetase